MYKYYFLNRFITQLSVFRFIFIIIFFFFRLKNE